MSDWLYPLSETAGRFFTDGLGKVAPVTFESFQEVAVAQRLKDDRWYLSTNYLRVNRGDTIWIYMGSRDLGVIGRATVDQVDLDDPDGPTLVLRYDRAFTAALVVDPVPAPLVRHFLPRPRAAVQALDPFPTLVKKLRTWTELRSATAAAGLTQLDVEPLTLDPLNLKKAGTATAKRRRNVVYHLLHDEVLGPCERVLRGAGFQVGGTWLDTTRPDLLGIKGKRLVVLEAKMIERGKGRDEARQAFGQLHEYSWRADRKKPSHYTHHLVAAFSARPGADVIDFLAAKEVLVAWTSGRKLVWSAPSVPKWKKLAAARG